MLWSPQSNWKCLPVSLFMAGDAHHRHHQRVLQPIISHILHTHTHTDKNTLTHTHSSRKERAGRSRAGTADTVGPDCSDPADLSPPRLI